MRKNTIKKKKKKNVNLSSTVQTTDDDKCETRYPARIREKTHNEPLINKADKPEEKENNSQWREPKNQ